MKHISEVLTDIALTPTEIEMSDFETHPVGTGKKLLDPGLYVPIELAKEQQERIAFLRGALDGLARLGNEPNYGNSVGNSIARRALETDAEKGADNES